MKSVILSNEQIADFWEGVRQLSYEYKLFHQPDRDAETIAKNAFGDVMWEEQLTNGDLGGVVYSEGLESIAWVSIRSHDNSNPVNELRGKHLVRAALIPPKRLYRTRIEKLLLRRLNKLLLETQNRNTG
jgi:hypothetical protein